MFLFRPPYGDYDNEVITGVLSCGYYPIQWSIDSLDWKDYGVDDIITRICDNKQLTGGAIILCHNGAKYTADALDTLLTQLEEKGFQFGRYLRRDILKDSPISYYFNNLNFSYHLI